MAVFKETVNIQPVSTTSGAASGLLSLADRISAFGGQAFSLAETELTAKAQARGQESAAITALQKKGGITQAPELKEEHFIGGIEIKSHNKALRAAYLASLSTDIRDSIGRIQQDHPADIIQFNENINGLRKGIMSGVEPAFRQEIGTFFDSKSGTAGLNVRGKDIQRQHHEAKATIEGAIDKSSNEAAVAARNGDNLTASEGIVETVELFNQLIDIEKDPAKKNALVEERRDFQREVAEQTFRREFDILSDDNLQDAFDLVKEKRKEVPKFWTPDEWDTYLNSQNAELNRKQSSIRKEIKATEAEISKQESLSRGAQFEDPDIPADPTRSSQDRKDVNLRFDEVIAPSLQGQNGETQIEIVEKFIGNTGIIPDALVSKFNGSMRSGNTENVIIFSKIINDLAESQNASVLRDLPDQTRSVALQITSAVSSGMDIETATEVARKNAYGLTKADKERINLETQLIRPELPIMLTDMIDKHFDPDLFTAQPETSAAIQAEFNVAFENRMIMTDGDSQQSALLASEDVRKSWGRNNIDGDTRMMKFAPSVFYSVPGVDNDWMEDQFQSDLSGFGDVDNFRIGINIDSISSGTPTYPVMSIDKSGIASPVFDKEGNLIEWAPDFSITREYKEMKALPGKITKEAVELKKKADRLKKILGQDTGGFL